MREEKYKGLSSQLATSIGITYFQALQLLQVVLRLTKLSEIGSYIDLDTFTVCLTRDNMDHLDPAM